MFRGLFRGFSILSVLLILTASVPSFGQVPSEEQLELLRSMSPEDRAALLEQLGLSGTALTGDAATDAIQDSPSGNRNARDLDASSRGERNSELKNRLGADRTLKPEDTLLIDIDFKKDKPGRIETPVPGEPPVTVPGERAPVLEPEERARLQSLIDLIRSRNPYQL